MSTISRSSATMASCWVASQAAIWVSVVMRPPVSLRAKPSNPRRLMQHGHSLASCSLFVQGSRIPWQSKVLGEPAAMSAPSNPHFATFVTMLIDTLAAMMPGSGDDSKETRRDIARLMFEAFQPRDAIEAMAAARAVAAHHAAMDNFERAAQH